MSDKKALVAWMKSQGFPKVKEECLEITSPVDFTYNCIAWAAQDSSKWWWPDPMNQSYWPSSAPVEQNVEAFIAAYGTIGFSVCPDGKLEKNYEKIVIYCHNNIPTHAARLVKEDIWTSKLGQANDISHTIDSLDGPAYGSPHTYMKRKI